MPFFPYRCPVCLDEWDERRDRNDPDLDNASQLCREQCYYDGPRGKRVRFETAPPVYFHGMGWSRVDKNYPRG
jgi:hypothetical protein